MRVWRRLTSSAPHWPISHVFAAGASAVRLETMDLKRTSKFLSLILRHEPAKFGVVLDAAGWVPVEALLSACARHGHAIDRAMLERVVAENDKKRFSFDESGERIRANQGHSVDVELGYEAAQPPDLLYHGTAVRFVDAIRAEGLKKMARHHVHLSADEVTARAVGQRHGKPAVLVIDAAAMAAEGIAFYVSANKVWLVEHVPARFIRFPA
jgi:putative RNA 2'-phosphotransferase